MHKLAAALIVMAGVGCASQPSDQLEPIDLTIRQRPQVTIASPAPGSFLNVAQDGMIDVTGVANGSAIVVNGHSTAVDSHGNFHARIPASEGVNVARSTTSARSPGRCSRRSI